MEIKTEFLQLFGGDQRNRISTIQPEQSLAHPSLSRQKPLSPRRRKLFLQYQTLMRRMEVQQKMDEKQNKVSQRLEQVKCKRELGRLNPIKRGGRSMECLVDCEKIQFKEVKRSQKKGSSSYEVKKGYLMNATSTYNAFRVYNKQHHKSSLPSLNKVRNVRANKQVEKEGPPELLDFGIFSQHKTSETFLRKLKTATQRQFPCGLSTDNEESLVKFELLLLREIKNEGNWLMDS